MTGEEGPPTSLVDHAPLHVGVSRAAAAERQGRGETSHTVHVWWARRPHGAMRALTFATLCRSEDDAAVALLDRLGATPLPEPGALAEARALLHAQYGRPPRVLDLFGGGGTIGLEASNLGATVTTVDVNELSVFLQRSHLSRVTADRIPALCDVVRESGERVLERLRLRTVALFPRRARGEALLTYLWTYSWPCPACGYRFHLGARPWLSRKPGRTLRLEFTDGVTGQQVGIIDGGAPVAATRRARTIGCPRCAVIHRRPSVRACRDELVAVVAKRGGSGKAFLVRRGDEAPAERKVHAFETDILRELGANLPTSRLPRWSGIVNPALSGMETHADVFNPRQRVVLLALILELRREHGALRAALPGSEADFVLAALSSLVDQLVDWNCRLSVWIPQNEQVGRALSGPGIPMVWDYAETDPVSRGPANLHAKLDRIVAGLASLAHRSGPVEVLLADARRVPLPDGSFDAIVTDPPYYDNVYYSVLADFVFAWKRILLRDVDPLFEPTTTAQGGLLEVVASTRRLDGTATAEEAYTRALTDVLLEAARLLKPDGTLSLVYGHGALAAWRGVVAAFRRSGLRVDATRPLALERRARPRAVRSAAVHTCVAIVARPWSGRRAEVDRAWFDDHVRAVLAGPLAGELEDAGWADEDVGMALFAQGVTVLANVGSVQGATDAVMIEEVARRVRARCPAFRITERRSL